jgi:hypothetical protein
LVRALSIRGSDHAPLLSNSGEQAHLGNKHLFSFELSWLREEGLTDMIEREWNSVVRGNSPIEVWKKQNTPLETCP